MKKESVKMRKPTWEKLGRSEKKDRNMKMNEEKQRKKEKSKRKNERKKR